MNKEGEATISLQTGLSMIREDGSEVSIRNNKTGKQCSSGTGRRWLKSPTQIQRACTQSCTH